VSKQGQSSRNHDDDIVRGNLISSSEPMLTHASPMSHAPHLTKLEKSIERYLERHAQHCLLRALAVALLAASLSSALCYSVTGSSTAAISLFGLIGLIALNLAFMYTVPSIKSRKDSSRFLLGGAADPSVIDDVKPGVVQLKNASGESQELNRVERRAWQEMVVPYLCRLHTDTLAQQKASRTRILTASEMRYYKEERARIEREQEQMRQEVSALQAKRSSIEDLQASLLEEERALEAAKEDMQVRADSLVDAENMVITRLSEIEVAEAEMEQLRENLQHQQQGSRQSSNADQLDAHEATLKAKEAELDALRQSLIDDKQVVEQQKTELNQLKGDLIQAADQGSMGDSNVSTLQLRERELEEKMRQLESARVELDERTQYVNEVENSLIDKLNSLSEREAFVEQGEANVGLRES